MKQNFSNVLIKRYIVVSIFVALGCFRAAGSELEIEYETSALPRDQQFTPHSYSSMLSAVKPAVVSVYTANIVRVVRSNGLSPQDEMLRRFFGLPLPDNRR
ncbi:MAG: hypothetical protein AAF546_09185, partial [Verrucomicrobiota bacterium]